MTRASRELTSVLADMDTSRLRSTPHAMREAVRQVVDAGATSWTAGWLEFAAAIRDVARVDLCLARLVEGHADAMRILAEAGATPVQGVYGVWASRSVGTGLRASQSATGWTLDGELRFASGADLIDRALVPGWVDADHHWLFDIPTRELKVDESSWASAGMDASRSFTVDVTAIDAGDPVGALDFYLSRPGFAAGGIGPAAAWAGGAHQLADLVAAGLARFEPTTAQLARLGAVEQAAWLADAAITAAADALEDSTPGGSAVAVAHARLAAVQASDIALAQAPVIVGPGGLSTSLRLARTLADLAMYVRQHHLDRELEAAGRRALDHRQQLGT